MGNKKIALLVLILLIGSGLLFWIYSKSRCGQFFGVHSYAWGGGSEKCSNAGCSILKVKEVDNPKLVDDDGFYYICFPK